MPSLREMLLHPFLRGRQAAGEDRRGDGSQQQQRTTTAATAPASEGEGEGQEEEEEQQHQHQHQPAPAPASPVRRPTPWLRTSNLIEADTKNLARCVRLREQSGRRMLPRCDSDSDSDRAAVAAVLAKARGVNEPAEREHFARPPPASPFPDLVLALGQRIDEYLVQRKALEEGGGGLLGRMWPVQLAAAVRLWRPVTEAVAQVRDRLLMEGLSREEQAREREMFIDARGPETLLRLLEPPVTEPAALRAMRAEVLMVVAEAYIDALSLTRDLVYFVPDLAPRLASPARVVALFGLLRFDCTFDHATGLLEDLLVDQSFSPFLGDVPHLNELLEGLSLRQLAHFCRVLALLVFDPEDRFLMESHALLQSHDILQCRRDRPLRPNPNCDRNQALLLNLPSVLPRLVQILRVSNFGPSVHELAASRNGARGGQQQQQGQGQQRRPHDLFLLLADMMEQHDWRRIDRLEATASSAAAGGGGAGTRAGRRQAMTPTELLSLIQPLLLARVRQRFAPPDPRMTDRVLALVHRMGDGDDGDGDDGSSSGGGSNAPGEGEAAIPAAAGEEDGAVGGWGAFLRRAGLVMGAGGTSTSNSSSSAGDGGGDGAGSTAPAPLDLSVGQARSELAFYATALTAFQTEVLFVLTSLAGGRRKVDAQGRLLELGLLEALTAMFPRLSWGKRARHTHHHQQHQQQHAGTGPEDEEGQPPPIFVNIAPGAVGGLEAFAGLGLDGAGVGAGAWMEEVGSDYEDEDEDGDDEDEDEEGTQQLAGGMGEESDADEEDDEDDDGEPTRLHGENCNCAPDSGLRVQFLRLLHNLLDRDDAGAFPALKSRALGAGERAALLRGDEEGALAAAAAASTAGKRGRAEAPGLVSLVVEALGKEKRDSAERFWLSSCLEAFLRGSGPSVQRHVVAAHRGLVERQLLGEILAEDARATPAGAQQSAFDLLGELSRGNPAVLARVEAALEAEVEGEGEGGGGGGFERLEAAILRNLVDSNVFLRSLLLALYVEDYDEGQEGQEQGGQGGQGGVSFLRQSWARPTMARVSALVGGDGGGGSAGAVKADADADAEADPVLHQSLAEEAWLRGQGRGQRQSFPRPGSPEARALLPRFHAFLEREWVALLRAMMAAVDFSRVSTESLCVINSALLMLLLSRRQGRLPAIVAELRALQADALAKAGQQRPKESFSWSWSEEEEKEEKEKRKEDDNVEGEGGEEGKADRDPDRIRHPDFLSNFRALLLFWREYYCGRGRDRLSLAFSSKIPFPEWRALLDALCADSPEAEAALVPAPLRLPRSPYARPPRHPVCRCAR